jgi:hypothetical protein
VADALRVTSTMLLNVEKPFIRCEISVHFSLMIHVSRISYLTLSDCLELVQLTDE